MFSWMHQKKTTQRLRQLPPDTYGWNVSRLLVAHYRGPNHPFKLRILNLIEKLLGPKRLIASTDYGFSFSIDQADLIQRHVLYDKVWEADLSSVFAAEFRNDDVFLDIGANVGYFSCFALKHGVKHVIACDPDPINCGILRRNLEINSFELNCVEILQCGLGVKEETLQFNRANVGNTGVSGFHELNAVDRFMVQVTTIDKLFEGNIRSKPTIIKMDVEGWEENVVRGGLKFLKAYQPRLVVFEAICDDKGKILNTSLIDVFESVGYEVTKTLLSGFGCNHLARPRDRVET